MSDRAGRIVAVTVGIVALGAMALTAPRGEGPSPTGEDGAMAAGADTVRLVPTTRVTPGTDGVVADADSAETAAASGGAAEPPRPDRAKATFAGGCFWCMEPPFDHLEGVISTTSGYAGGHVKDPSYEQVSAGGTGHRESVQVVYDPSVVSYTKLLEVFWHNVDPTDDGGQFCDRGFQYTTAIFYHNSEQEELAEASKRRLQESGALPGDVVTTVVPLDGDFYAAEDYHQDYYEKNPVRYRFYRWRCGRDDRLEELWGDAAGH